MAEQQIFTLKQVLTSIRKTIENRYQQHYWVKAEMHKLNRFPSGHCFPELLQKEDGKVVAQIKGTIWRTQFEQINRRFMEVVREPLKEDSTLLLLVKINFDEIYGMGLVVLDIDPSYSLGELQRERNETIKRLHAENLLNANQNLPFPLLPSRIAVISAEASKGLSDFDQILDKNPWGYRFFRMLFQSSLQGDQAVPSILSALEKIRKVKDHFDVVVIVRGGGGEVGLSCYNNYELCSALASFPLPVMTGIGHSTNLTVAEMVAFRNAITPTELAEVFIQSYHQFSIPLTEAGKTLRLWSESILKDHGQLLTTNSDRFRQAVKQGLKSEQTFLDGKLSQLQKGIRFRNSLSRNDLQQYHEKLRQFYQLHLLEESRQIKLFRDRFSRASRLLLEREWLRLSTQEKSVRQLDPIRVLRRGYSIVTLNGKLTGQDNRPAPGDELHIETAESKLTAAVTTIKIKK